VHGSVAVAIKAYLDVTAWVKAIKLSNNLQHSTLYFIITTTILTTTSATTYGINLIKKDDTSL
jgi:hypothetical protein